MADLSSRAKVAAAAVGGGALVTMGALAFVTGGGQPTVSPSFVSGGMTTGVTITETTPDTALATSVAVPTVKATFFGKS